MNREYCIKPVGDRAVQVMFEQKINENVNGKVMALRAKLAPGAISGIMADAICEMIPSFAALVIQYDPLKTDFDSMKGMLEQVLEESGGQEAHQGRLIEIPVCYGGKFGEDLAYVASHAELTEEEVIRIHSGREYRIYMLGFLPGFPYLGGMDERIFTPRLSSPRTAIPAGSVGIGGEQTGIYPMESPGGWQLIGRTPLRLFRPEENGRLPYEAGDRIRFIPIDEETFERLNEHEEGN